MARALRLFQLFTRGRELSYRDWMDAAIVLQVTRGGLNVNRGIIPTVAGGGDARGGTWPAISRWQMAAAIAVAIMTIAGCSSNSPRPSTPETPLPEAAPAATTSSDPWSVFSSNPQVAQILFITRPTVEAHLRSIFRKLEITSRHQLAPLLAAAKDH